MPAPPSSIRPGQRPSPATRNHASLLLALTLFGALATSGCVLRAARPTSEVEASPRAARDRIAPEVYEAWMEAEVASLAGDLETAVDALARGLQMQPSEARLHERRAEHLLTLRRLDEADRHIRRLDTLGAPPWRVAMLDAYRLEAAGDLEDAFVRLGAADLSEAPSKAYDQLLQLAQRRGDPSSIESVAARWTDHEPRSTQAWRRRATALREAGNLVGASMAFRQASELATGTAADAESALLLALDSEDMALADDQFAHCRRRYRSHPDCLTLGVRLALALEPSPDGALPPSAQARVTDLAALVGGDRFAIARAGAVLRRHATVGAVVHFVDQIRAQRPFNVASLTQAAWVAYGIGENDLAVEVMEAVLVLDDANFDALNFIGYDWAERGIHLERAERYIREALFLRPDDANIQDSLAWVLFRQGRVDEAWEVQAQVVRELPDNATILDHWGDILAARGAWEEAIEAWERAIERATPAEATIRALAPAKIEDARRRIGLPES